MGKFTKQPNASVESHTLWKTCLQICYHVETIFHLSCWHYNMQRKFNISFCALYAPQWLYGRDMSLFRPDLITCRLSFVLLCVGHTLNLIAQDLAQFQWNIISSDSKIHFSKSNYTVSSWPWSFLWLINTSIATMKYNTCKCTCTVIMTF